MSARFSTAGAFGVAAGVTLALALCRLAAPADAHLHDTMLAAPSPLEAAAPSLLLLGIALAYVALPLVLHRSMEGRWARLHFWLTSVPLVIGVAVGTVTSLWPRAMLDSGSFLHHLMTRGIAAGALRTLLPCAFVIGQVLFVAHLLRVMLQPRRPGHEER